MRELLIPSCLLLLKVHFVGYGLFGPVVIDFPLWRNGKVHYGEMGFPIMGKYIFPFMEKWGFTFMEKWTFTYRRVGALPTGK